MGSGHRDWQVQALYTKRHQRQAPMAGCADRKKVTTADSLFSLHGSYIPGSRIYSHEQPAAAWVLPW